MYCSLYQLVFHLLQHTQYKIITSIWFIFFLCIRIRGLHGKKNTISNSKVWIEIILLNPLPIRQKNGRGIEKRQEILEKIRRKYLALLLKKKKNIFGLGWGGRNPPCLIKTTYWWITQVILDLSYFISSSCNFEFQTTSTVFSTFSCVANIADRRSFPFPD